MNTEGRWLAEMPLLGGAACGLWKSSVTRTWRPLTGVTDGTIV